jgi:hypothetical protein
MLLHPGVPTKILMKNALAALKGEVKAQRLPNLTAFIAAYARAVVIGGLAIVNALDLKQFSLKDLEDRPHQISHWLAHIIHTALAYVRRPDISAP